MASHPTEVSATGAPPVPGDGEEKVVEQKHVEGEEQKKKRKVPRLDVHTHILPEHLPDFKKRYGEGDWVRLDHHCPCKAKMYKGDKFFREVDENCYRVEPRLKECDEAEVHVQVLSTVPVMFNYNAKPAHTLDLARFLNNHIAEICRKHPTRFVGLGTLPMQAPELAIQELRRCMGELGLAGAQIGSHINDWALSDPNLFPIWEEAERLGACIFVHPWDMPGMGKEKYWLPWLVEMPKETAHAICSMIFGGVMERFPRLRLCFAHGGGSFPATIGRIEHGFNVRPDLVAVDNKVPPRNYLGKFWLDSLVHDEDALASVTKLVGENKVVLGSDYPFPLGEHQPGKLIATHPQLSEEAKAKMLWYNGLEFIGRSEEDFLKDDGADDAEAAEATEGKSSNTNPLEGSEEKTPFQPPPSLLQPAPSTVATGSPVAVAVAVAVQSAQAQVESATVASLGENVSALQIAPKSSS